jgi:hypothetical protein
MHSTSNVLLRFVIRVQFQMGPLASNGNNGRWVNKFDPATVIPQYGANDNCLAGIMQCP